MMATRRTIPNCQETELVRVDWEDEDLLWVVITVQDPELLQIWVCVEFELITNVCVELAV
jgi:hypothetical protein